MVMPTKSNEVSAGGETEVLERFRGAVEAGTKSLLGTEQHRYNGPVLDLMKDLEKNLSLETPDFCGYFDAQGEIEVSGGAIDPLYAGFRQNYKAYVEREGHEHANRKNAIHLAQEALTVAAGKTESGFIENPAEGLAVGAYICVLDRLIDFEQSVTPLDLGLSLYDVSSEEMNYLVKRENLLTDFKNNVTGSYTYSDSRGSVEWVAERLRQTPSNTTLQEMYDDVFEARTSLDRKLHPKFEEFEELAGSLKSLTSFPKDGLEIVVMGFASGGVKLSDQSYGFLLSEQRKFMSVDKSAKADIYNDNSESSGQRSRPTDFSKVSTKDLWDAAVLHLDGVRQDSFKRWVAGRIQKPEE